MTLKKVTAGQRLNIPAKTWNQIIDVIDFLAKNKQNLLALSGLDFLKGGIVNIENISGANRNINDVLVLGNSSILTAGLDAFRTGAITFQGVLASSVPVATLHTKQFAILQESIKENEVGKGLILGVTVARININNAGHERAKLKDDSIDLLESAYAGPVKILWRESGDTGDKWALVSMSRFPWINWRPNNFYTIDRTDPANDALLWDPSTNKPTDWENYDGVKLITQSLRYISGASASLDYINQEFYWLTEYAPVIESVTPVAADVSECP